MNHTFIFRSSLAAGVALLTVACESSNGASAPTRGEPSMRTTLSALEAALEECKEQRDACTANVGDATVDRGCQEAFVACKRGAIDGAMPDLTENVNVCAEQARSCREAATDEAGKTACRDALRTCLDAREQGRGDRDADVDESGDEQPRGENGKPDGGVKEEHESPVASCTSALHGCLDGDQAAKLCTDELRACLEETLPNHANGQDERPDAGKADEDHGKDEDAGRGQSGEHKPSDAGVDRPEKTERDAGRGKPQA